MKLFLSEEDEEIVKKNLHQLKEDLNLEYVECGDIGVKISDTADKSIIFDVYRIISVLEVRKSELKKKVSKR